MSDTRTYKKGFSYLYAMIERVSFFIKVSVCNISVFFLFNDLFIYQDVVLLLFSFFNLRKEDNILINFIQYEKRGVLVV